MAAAKLAANRLNNRLASPAAKPVDRLANTPGETVLTVGPADDDGIEILLTMARQGQIDPWNVDLVSVANHYLRTVAQQRGFQHVDSQLVDAQAMNSQAVVTAPTTSPVADLDSTALRVTGKTLLYLAILLRMKSDLLAGLDPFALQDASAEDLAEWNDDPDFSDSSDAFAPIPVKFPRRVQSLESVLERRTSAKQPRIRPVTLEDLIRELRRYEALEQERALRRKVETVDQRRRLVDFTDLTTEEITELAHEEFSESIVSQVRLLLEAHLPTEPGATMSLTDIQDLCGLDRASAFLSVLFLEARHEVESSQQAFYADDLQVGWPEESTTLPEETASSTE
ncbi:MAG: segregation/condensation protein A [Candidatus Melainabacteria bacterium]|nr:segregation/condensation protein A [Candidatus Melainabacteria bacterium]